MGSGRLGWSWLRRLRVAGARIGVHPHERGRGQPLRIDVGMQLDVAAAAAADCLAATADWDAVLATVRATVAARHYGLVESLCEALAAALLASQPRVRRVRVRVEKPESVAIGIAVVAIERRRGARPGPA